MPWLAWWTTCACSPSRWRSAEPFKEKPGLRAAHTGSGPPEGSRNAKEVAVYVIPFVALLLVVAIGAVWSPIFALLIAVPLFLVFLGYVGFSRRADQTARPSSGEPVSGEGEAGGVWGEKRV
jgi:hypothetical protein